MVAVVASGSVFGAVEAWLIVVSTFGAYRQRTKEREIGSCAESLLRPRKIRARQTNVGEK